MKTKKQCVLSKILMLCFVMAAVLLAGCSGFSGPKEYDPDNPGSGAGGGNTGGGGGSEGGGSGGNPGVPPTVVDAGNPSIKDKFGIETAGEEGVRDAFFAVQNYINIPNLQVTGEGANLKLGDIALGDWIDLDGGLKVAEYEKGGENKGTDIYKGYADIQNDTMTGDNTNKGTKLRLIVVGINSFNNKNDNGERPHLVFQFLNIPALHRMSGGNVNYLTNRPAYFGGYAGSELREYLVPIPGVTGTGAFLKGLENAGVPKSVLWAPRRMVWHGTGSGGKRIDVISDLLWIPTEREMFYWDGHFRFGPFSDEIYENAENQGRLQYYDYDNKRRKFYSNDYALNYYLASLPRHSVEQFCAINESGCLASDLANFLIGNTGVVPAFCVKGFD